MTASPKNNALHDHRACVREGLGAAERLAAEKGVRLTPDRRQVLEILLQKHAALGAYDIAKKIKWGSRKRASSIIYRALDALSSLGLVHKLYSRQAFVACFAPEPQHGALFLICSQCQSVSEIASTAIKNSIFKAAQKEGFHLQSQIVEMEGLCPSCSAR